MEVAFFNVLIVIDAPSPSEAYDALCNALATIQGGDRCEWETDTYSCRETGANHARTVDIYPGL